MRFVLALLAGWGATGMAHAQGVAALRNCVGTRELQDLVSTKAVVAPAAAILAARRQVPGADVVRGNLCWWDNALVYVIMALRKDGRLVQVRIDAPSGKVLQ